MSLLHIDMTHLSKTRAYIFYIVNTMAADVPAT